MKEENDACRSAIDFYILSAKLKDKIISCCDSSHWNVKSDRIESIAEHVYGTCILDISMYSEFNFDINLEKTLKMLILHEIGEVLIGDITPFDKITPQEKEELEHKAMQEVLGDLNLKGELFELLLEFDERKTNEAKFAYYCDKLEADIQAKIYQDKGKQRSLDDQKDNIVFNNSNINKMIEDGAKTAFDIWYLYDKDKFKNSKEFAKVLRYVKDNNLEV